MARSGSNLETFDGDIQLYQFEPDEGMSGDESGKPPTAKFRLVCELNDNLFGTDKC